MAAIGWAVMAFGIRGLFHERLATNPTHSIRLFLEAAIVHDALIAPVVFALGFLVSRLVPARVRAAVQSGLIVSAVVVAFSYPLVRGFGRAATNPSALPLNYGRGLAIVLTAVWVVVVLVILGSGPGRFSRIKQ